MTRLLFLFLFALPLFALNAEAEHTTVLGDIKLESAPGALPEELPSFFKYPDSTIRINGIAEGGNYSVFTEGASILKTEDDLKKVESYYTKELRVNSWNIIQSHHKESEILLMAESAFQKLVTIILRTDPSGTGTVIKVYYKHSGAE